MRAALGMTAAAGLPRGAHGGRPVAPRRWHGAGHRRGLLVAVALHIVLLWCMWRGLPDRHPATTDVPHRAATVRLLADTRAPLPQAPGTPPRPPGLARAMAPSPSPSPSPRRLPIHPPPGLRAAPAALSLPAAPAALPLPGVAPPAGRSPAAAEAAEAAASASALPALPEPRGLPPLDLQVHPVPSVARTMQQQIADDARANPWRQTFGERMAHDLDQTETSETLADGSIRHRRGADCMIEHPSRVAQLFPLDEGTKRAPPVWGPCP